MYESMIFKCRCVRFLAAVAGGIRWAQAYQPSTSGSAITFGLRYSSGSVINSIYPKTRLLAENIADVDLSRSARKDTKPDLTRTLPKSLPSYGAILRPFHALAKPFIYNRLGSGSSGQREIFFCPQVEQSTLFSPMKRPIQGRARLARHSLFFNN